MRIRLLAASAALVLGACADATAPAPPPAEGRLLVQPAPIQSEAPLPAVSQAVGASIFKTLTPISRAIHETTTLAAAEAVLNRRLAAHTDASTRPIVVFTACQNLLERRIYLDGVTDDERPFVARCAERLGALSPQAPLVVAPMLDALRGHWPEARIRAAAEASLASARTAAKTGAQAQAPSLSFLAGISETLASAQQARPAREAEATRRLEAIVAQTTGVGQ